MKKVILPIRWLLVNNAIGIALVIIGAEYWLPLELFGWVLLLPGSAIAAGIELGIAPLIDNVFSFWNVADVAFLPASVAINVLAIWIARRIRERWSHWTQRRRAVARRAPAPQEPAEDRH